MANYVNLAGCSSIYAGYGFYGNIKGDLERSMKNKGARAVILTMPAGKVIQEKVFRDLGGRVIENIRSAHNAKGMNIWLIPGIKDTSLYEGRASGEIQRADEKQISEEQQKRQLLLNVPKLKKKRINWKKKFLSLQTKTKKKAKRG